MTRQDRSNCLLRESRGGYISTSSLNLEDKISNMETDESSASSGWPRSDSSEASNRRRTSSLPRDGPWTTRNIVVGVKANEKLRLEIFVHALKHLGDPTTCRMVVVDCVSKLRDEFGLNRKADIHMFGGANERKLDAEVKKHNTNMNLILNPLRKKLEQSGCRFDILTRNGAASANILIQAAKALNPYLVVLEHSFGKDRKKIQRELPCRVALMKRNPLETPELFEFMSTNSGRIDGSHDQYSQEISSTTFSEESDNSVESPVYPEPFGRTPAMNPSRLPFPNSVPDVSSGSFLFALKGYFSKK